MNVGRVVASDEARSRIQWLQTQLSAGIVDLRTKFNQANQTLTDREHWDGPHALKYQSDVIPQITGMLNNWERQVADLSQTINGILGEIMSAGGRA